MSIYLGKNKVGICGITNTDNNELVAFIEKGPIGSMFENSKITKIRYGAFYSCISLTTASFPACTSIGNSAFFCCYSLTTVSFPVCTTIGSNAFYACSNLTTADFPACTTIGDCAFAKCSKFTMVNFPVCTSIGAGVFSNCYSLKTVSFPVCTSLVLQAFASCSSLTTVSFPACAYIGTSAFYSCANLSTVILNTSQTALMIQTTAFGRCYKLTSLYLLANTMYNLSNINAFSSTPISTYTTSTGGVYGSIFVRESLYASYKAATNWATYSSRFVSLTDAQISNVMASGTHT